VPQAAAPAPGDEAGPYSWMQLETMNEKFRGAMQNAIARGEERSPTVGERLSAARRLA
jgi:hypothetical protein